MTRKELVARALANALLDGEWAREPMIERVAFAFGGRRAWMARLAREALGLFPRAPGDARDLLARRLRTVRGFEAACRHRHALERWAIPAPRMGRIRWPVPTIETVGDLAQWLGIEALELEVLADRRGLARDAELPMRHYTYRWIAKRRGGHRLLEAPKARLKAVQRRVLHGILDAIPPHDAAHGFRAGRSVVSFARVHVGAAVVVRVDLEAFFPSVFAGRVYGVFRGVGYPEEVARTLTAICTHRAPKDVLAAAPRDPASISDRPRVLERLRTPHLPQGAPTSPAIANLVAFALDVRVAALAKALDARYARYADDLVISGGAGLGPSAERLVGTIETIAREEGFFVAKDKTRVQRRAQRQEVAGVVVNEKPSLRRDDLDRLRAILHNCATRGPATQNRDERPDFRAHLLGRVAWVEQVDRSKGARLRALFDRIAW